MASEIFSLTGLVVSRTLIVHGRLFLEIMFYAEITWNSCVHVYVVYMYHVLSYMP